MTLTNFWHTVRSGPNRQCHTKRCGPFPTIQLATGKELDRIGHALQCARLFTLEPDGTYHPQAQRTYRSALLRCVVDYAFNVDTDREFLGVLAELVGVDHKSITYHGKDCCCISNRIDAMVDDFMQAHKRCAYDPLSNVNCMCNQ
jgi:hypothetical protein